MAHYIDADRLRAEIERRREICADIAGDERNEEVAEYYRGKEVAHDEISSLITSLQQEQAEKDLIHLAQLWVDSGDANVMSFEQFLKCYEAQSYK